MSKSKYNFSGASIRKSQIGEKNTMNIKKEKEKDFFVLYEFEGKRYHSNTFCGCNQSCFIHGNEVNDYRDFNDEVDVCFDGVHYGVPGVIVKIKCKDNLEISSKNEGSIK